MQRRQRGFSEFLEVPICLGSIEGAAVTSSSARQRRDHQQFARCGHVRTEFATHFAINEELDVRPNLLLLVDHAKTNAGKLAIQIAQYGI